MKIEVDQYQNIRHLYIAQGLSKREIARRLRISRNTVAEQDMFRALRAHYAFQADFCNPGEVHEKGLVENLVGYIRRNVFVPVLRVESWDELNRLLSNHCLKYLNHRIPGRSQTVGEALEVEKKSLLPLPANRLQSEGKPASERREKLGQNGMEGAKEGAIIDEQRIAERLAEAGLYQTIYQRNLQINAIIFKASPELQCLSRAGVGLKPLLDDFAQIVGLQVRTFDQKEPDRIARALRKSAAVLIKDTGALCCGASEDDAKAVAMILQKNAKALIGAVLFGKVQPINAFESMLMRFVYLKKYAKQAFVSGTESRRQ